MAELNNTQAVAGERGPTGTPPRRKGTARAAGRALRNTSLLHNPDAISSHNCKLFPCFENNPDANFKCLSPGHTMKKICLADNLQNHRTQAQTSQGSVVLFSPSYLRWESSNTPETAAGTHPLEPFWCVRAHMCLCVWV